jgi:hypothetical protein
MLIFSIDNTVKNALNITVWMCVCVCVCVCYKQKIKNIGTISGKGDKILYCSHDDDDDDGSTY